MSDSAPTGTGSVLPVLLAVTIAAAAGQDKCQSVTSAQPAKGKDQKVAMARGEIVSELGESAIYVFQAKNRDYWFGSNDRGLYRYDGKVIVNFTTKDGLCSNRI